MNKYNYCFGPTRCGEILDEKISFDKDYKRKVRSFYSESMSVFANLADIQNERARRILRLAYLRQRLQQFEDDVFLGRPEGMDGSVYSELVYDIQKRMNYLLRSGSTKYISKSS